ARRGRRHERRPAARTSGDVRRGSGRWSRPHSVVTASATVARVVTAAGSTGAVVVCAMPGAAVVVVRGRVVVLVLQLELAEHEDALFEVAGHLDDVVHGEAGQRDGGGDDARLRAGGRAHRQRRERDDRALHLQLVVVVVLLLVFGSVFVVRLGGLRRIDPQTHDRDAARENTRRRHRAAEGG